MIGVIKVSEERRNGMKELEVKLDKIGDSHIQCRAETKSEISGLSNAVRDVKGDVARLSEKVNQIHNALTSKINGVDKELSVEIARNLQSRVDKRSIAVGGSAGLVATAVLNAVWQWLKTKM